MSTTGSVLAFVTEHGPQSARQISKGTKMSLITTKNAIQGLRGQKRVIASGPRGKRMYAAARTASPESTRAPVASPQDANRKSTAYKVAANSFYGVVAKTAPPFNTDDLRIILQTALKSHAVVMIQIKKAIDALNS
jgi:hypothetical protein